MDIWGPWNSMNDRMRDKQQSDRKEFEEKLRKRNQKRFVGSVVLKCGTQIEACDFWASDDVSALRRFKEFLGNVFDVSTMTVAQGSPSNEHKFWKPGPQKHDTPPPIPRGRQARKAPHALRSVISDYLEDL